MQRVVAILLLAGFLALGTGAMEFLHNRDHLAQDTEATALAAKSDLPAHPAPAHDDSNCAVHRQLHVPMMTAGYVPLLVCLGLFVAFLSQLTPTLVSQRVAFRLDCRGPPAC